MGTLETMDAQQLKPGSSSLSTCSVISRSVTWRHEENGVLVGSVCRDDVGLFGEVLSYVRRDRLQQGEADDLSSPPTIVSRRQHPFALT